jgi:hypothetical protein
MIDPYFENTGEYCQKPPPSQPPPHLPLEAGEEHDLQENVKASPSRDPYRSPVRKQCTQLDLPTVLPVYDTNVPRYRGTGR